MTSLYQRPSTEITAEAPIRPVYPPRRNALESSYALAAFLDSVAGEKTPVGIDVAIAHVKAGMTPPGAEDRVFSAYAKGRIARWRREEQEILDSLLRYRSEGVTLLWPR